MMKQIVLIGTIGGIGILVIVYGFYQWKQTQSILPSNSDCGNYSKYIGRGSNDKAEKSEKQKAVVGCIMKAYKSCQPATATVFGSDWEGGSHTSIYKIHKAENGDCEVIITSELKAWYAPDVGTREGICNEFFVEDNELICR